MRFYYVLDASGAPQPVQAIQEWAVWFERSDRERIVAKTHFAKERWEVSTVFLGLDHRFGGEGPPLLWETMIFGGPLDGEQWRWSGTREEVRAKHYEIVELAKAERDITKEA